MLSQSADIGWRGPEREVIGPRKPPKCDLYANLTGTRLPGLLGGPWGTYGYKYDS